MILMKEKTFATSCGTIHYWVNEIQTESALVFLPGLTADHRLFDKQIESFEGKCRVLVWDAPAAAAARHGIVGGCRSYNERRSLSGFLCESRLR